MGIRKELENIPDISFIENMSLESMQREMIVDFQEKYREVTGREISLAKADPSRLILYSAALQLYQAMQYLDRAGKYSFLKYSSGNYLDNLGALKGTERNSGEAARTTIRFTLSAVRPEAVMIPAGTRLTPGNSVFFYTEEECSVPAGELHTEISAVCAETGNAGNGYEAGEIRILVDKIAFVNEAVNTERTAGGAEEEDDENLAERIYLAPSSYSVAGPDGAYEYWVKTCNPSITDVKVYSPEPGTVDIRFILENGELPGENLVEQVREYLSEGERRPLTDRVIVGTPEIRGYDIRLKYWINESDKNSAATIQKNVDDAVKGYICWQKTRIGRDINPSKLNQMLICAGAKRAEIEEPVFTGIEETEIAVLREKTVLYGGIEDD